RNENFLKKIKVALTDRSPAEYLMPAEFWPIKPKKKKGESQPIYSKSNKL
ncbi:unnamed protein product, partial [marine sediment metagenome]